MSALTKITDWETKILENVLFQWKSRGADDGTIRQFFIDLGTEFQELEDAIFDLLEKRELSVATDNMLSRIGDAVEQFNPLSLPDSTYKALIYGKIAQNNSYGTQGDIVNILCLLGVNCDVLTIIEYYPARLHITYDGTNTFLTPAEILEILRAVTLEVTIELVVTTATPFGFDGDPNSFGFGVGELSEGI
jgi:hypothetical protein